MANLKLIKVTGSPFSDASIGRIGIQKNDYQFDIIREGRLYDQESSLGKGWKYATAEEIAENWKLIYPHWTPEPGDNVIVTQDYGSWANQRGTIVEASSSKGYYRVKRLPDDRVESFDYTCQMILAPTTSTTSTVTETKPKSPIGWQWQDLKVGDNVKIIGGDSSLRPIGAILTIDRMEDKDYKDKQPIKLIGSDGEDKGWPHIGTFEPYYGDVKPSKSSEPAKPEKETMHKFKIGDRVQCITRSTLRYLRTGTVREIGDANVGVEFDEYMSGHTLQGQCKNGYGWYIEPKDLDIVLSTKPKEETVTVRFLTEQEFKDKGLWNGTAPKGWNSRGDMNKYLGQSIVIPKSEIRSNGSFTYEDWTFRGDDYIVTEDISSSGSISKSVVTPIPKPEIPLRTFKVGDKVTYKSRGDSYHYGGDDQEGFVGTVEHTGDYVEDKGCYCLRVTTKEGDFCYNMLESEFHEYDSGYVPITSGAVGSSEPATRLVIKGSSAAGDGKHILVGGVAYPIRHYSSDGTIGTAKVTSANPLSLYEQKPITIKQKPKTKLTII